MSKTFLAGIGWAAAGAAVATMTIYGLAPNSAISATNSDIYRQLNLFGDVFDRVRSDYVTEPKEEKLIDSAINGMLTSLDPHSSYMNAKTFREMQVQTRGEFGGLGIEVTMENGVIKVVTPIDDTPASRAGVLAGDLITHLNDTPVRGLNLSQAVEKMRGKINTPITLTIVREGVEEPFDVKVVRDIIRIRAVRSRMEGEDVGYIRITTFNEQTQENLNAAIKKLKKKASGNLKGYVLDLRNNPGGLLDQAISVSDTFLDRGIIVVTRGRNAQEHQRYNANKGDMTGGMQVVVLINGGSASASEIVAGALQDHKRAKIIGTRSFGKGSVQTIIPLGSNGAIRLTTARYYTPSGTSIQAKGIVPDIKVEQKIPKKDAKRFSKPRGEASLPRHLGSEEGEEKSGSPSYVPAKKEDDRQLIYALNMVRGIEQKLDDNKTAKAKKAEKAEKTEDAGKPEKSGSTAN